MSEDSVSQLVNKWIKNHNFIVRFFLRQFTWLTVLELDIRQHILDTVQENMQADRERNKEMRDYWRAETKQYAQNNLATKKYKDTLQWYAEQSRYDVSKQYAGEGWFTEIEKDKGKMARDVLKS